jgi:hypothetical protein
LSEELSDEVVAVDAIGEYDGYVRKLAEVAWRYEDTSDFRKKLRQRRSQPMTHTVMQPEPRGTNIPVDAEGDVKMTGVNRLRSNAQPHGKGSADKPRARWASEEVMTKRKEESLCLRCGNGSHLIKNCPLLPAIRPRPSTTHIRRVAFQEVEEEDEDDAEEKE